MVSRKKTPRTEFEMIENGTTTGGKSIPRPIRSELDAASRVGERVDVSYPELIERLKRIEAAICSLANQKMMKEWYSTAEIAEHVGKAEFTVREWCRLGRIRADKRPCGRGSSQEWMISHEELQRVRNEGLLPDRNRYRHLR